MKKALTLFAFAMLFATSSFASYVVVLKDGTRYVAKEKYTIVNGKAMIKLESNNQIMQVDPSLIDVAKSEQLTKLGITSANIVDLTTNLPAKAPAPRQSLGNTIKLRQPGAAKKEEPAPATPAPVAPSNAMPGRVIENFERAYENVGIFDRTIVATGPNSIRAELSPVDSEDRVFNALSATSYLIVKNAGTEGVQIDVVEIFMKTTTGQAAGRFRMTRADAEAINSQSISREEYFVRNVIY